MNRFFWLFDISVFVQVLIPLASTTEGKFFSVKSSASMSDHHKNDGLRNAAINPVDSNAAAEIFLGGSTNPTTWRNDVAIPILEKWKISFYNPQVSEWTPDLIEQEHQAKERARVLFFVIDSQTRAVVSSIEIAYILGQNLKQLVLVINPYKPDQCISNEKMSPQEYLELKTNQQLLREMSLRKGVPIFGEVLCGLQQTRSILTGDNSTQWNCSSDSIPYSQDLLLKDDLEPLDLRDIYLDGSCSLRTYCRNEVISMLKKMNVTYYMSQDNSNRHLFNPSLLKSSHVSLFVISNDSRSLTSMTLAAYYIGLGYNIVLYIQNLNYGCTIGKDQLSKTSINDYNRGRSYLMNFAKLHEIPVFDD